MTEIELIHSLVALERMLHQAEVRRDPAQMAQLLHDEFVEFGRSGRTYTKAEIVESLKNEGPGQIVSQDFALRMLADGVALLTYRSAQVSGAGQMERHALRSSIWQQTDQGWQIIFHQGTPAEPPP